MIVLSPATAAIVATLAALWLGVALWSTLIGLRANVQARASDELARRLRSLMESAPAIPLVVLPDGRLEGPPQLARRLGLPSLPTTLDELAGTGAMVDVDVAGLVEDVAAARTAGARVERPLRMVDSDRILIARGGATAADGSPDTGDADAACPPDSEIPTQPCALIR